MGLGQAPGRRTGHRARVEKPAPPPPPPLVAFLFRRSADGRTPVELGLGKGQDGREEETSFRKERGGREIQKEAKVDTLPILLVRE